MNMTFKICKFLIVFAALSILVGGCSKSRRNYPSSTKEFFNQGEAYFYGIGVERNYDEAVKMYYNAAKWGYAEAQYALGNCYYAGKGVEKNYIEAERWFRKAAEQENKDAILALRLLQSHLSEK